MPRSRAPHPLARRAVRLCLIAILLLSSGAIPALAQSTPTASPAPPDGMRLYVGHDARLTAWIPESWTPDRSITADYRGPDGFVGSQSLWVGTPEMDSIDAMCRFVAEDPDAPDSIEMVTWQGAPACVIRTPEDRPDDRVALVFMNPHPSEDGYNRYVAVVTDSAHFDAITGSISFDQSRVTPKAYLEAALDLLEASWLWRDQVDWAAIREEAWAQVGDLSATDDLSASYMALQYITGSLRLAGPDMETTFFPPAVVEAGSQSGYAYVPPFGETLPGGIGYISLPGVLGGGEQGAQYTADTQALIERQRDTTSCGWILDLRQNSGTADSEIAGLSALVPAGPLFGYRNASGDVDAFSIEPDGTFAYDGAPYLNTPVRGVPSDPSLASQPVAVLIGPSSEFGAVPTAIALAHRDRTQLFGQPATSGATAAIYTSLFDGAGLILTVWWVSGPHGEIYPDGIAPNVITSGFASFGNLESDRGVQDAVSWLRSQPECADTTATPAG